MFMCESTSRGLWTAVNVGVHVAATAVPANGHGLHMLPRCQSIQRHAHHAFPTLRCVEGYTDWRGNCHPHGHVTVLEKGAFSTYGKKPAGRLGDQFNNFFDELEYVIVEEMKHQKSLKGGRRNVWWEVLWYVCEVRVSMDSQAEIWCKIVTNFMEKR